MLVLLEHLLTSWLEYISPTCCKLTLALALTLFTMYDAVEIVIITILQIFFYDIYTSDEASSTAERAIRGMGTDLAILDSAYFLSQVVLTACMGYIVHFSGTALSYIICSSAMAILSCYFVQSIVLDTTQMQQLIKSNQVTRCTTSVG